MTEDIIQNNEEKNKAMEENKNKFVSRPNSKFHFPLKKDIVKMKPLASPVQPPERMSGKIKVVTKNKHFIVVGLQIIFLMIVLVSVIYLYPRANVNVNGNAVNLNSINAKLIMISENPDFSNPRYIDLSEIKNQNLDLAPGKYYWKADNGIIEGFSGEFVIPTEVSLAINKTENDSDLVNIGNVKINITKEKGGVMVGRIILSPDESKKIDDNGEKYTGKQAG